MSEQLGPSKWYSTARDFWAEQPRGIVQWHGERNDLRKEHAKPVTLPEAMLRLAQAEYEHQHPNGQDYERMQERGGLGLVEVLLLLADLAERHGAKPTEPRKVADAG